ncbi:MAG: DUF3450 domain-containing protein [Candidatus Krumholzibacteriia bacterium]
MTRLSRAMGAGLLTAALALVALGQDAADRVAQVADQSQDTRRATQQELDRWAVERADLKARWDAAAAQVAYLEERARLERDRLAALDAAGDELARRLEESQRLTSSLEDTLLAILGRLDRTVAADLPFLAGERTARLDHVRRELGDPAASPAEKLRRVLEALLIETGYGGALEVDQQRIAVGDEELLCDLLSVGRLGLFWLTPDEARGGAWDPAARRYVELVGAEREAVRRAMQMATRRRPVGVQPLPLGKVGS